MSGDKSEEAQRCAFEAEVERLADGRTLTPFDREAVETVAGLTLRLRDCRRRFLTEPIIFDDGEGAPTEHPALVIEKRCSAELRGWVKDRPDLFGERKQKTDRSRRSATARFHVV